jgi:hypothetical protein
MSTTSAPAAKKSATDLFQSHDHYLVDELLTEEQRLIRDTARQHVSKHLKPIIEERFENATFSKDIIPGLAEIGAFGPIPARGIRRTWFGPDQLRPDHAGDRALR